MSHTPRPWFVGNPGGGKIARYTVSGIETSGGEVFVAAVGNGTTVPASITRAHANARLIAAAPDLLEVLQALIKLEAADATYGWTEKFDVARAAVAKARGAS